jgi:methyl-accepting chemotaxis protein
MQGIKKKIFALVIGAAVVMAAIGAFVSIAVLILHASGQDVQIAEEALVEAHDISETATEMHSAISDMAFFWVTGNTSELQNVAGNTVPAIVKGYEVAAAALNKAGLDSRFKTLMADVDAKYNGTFGSRDAFIAVVQGTYAGDNTALLSAKSAIDTAVSAYGTAADTLTDYLQEYSANLSAQSSALYSVILWITIVGIVLIIVVMIVAGLRIAKSIVTPVSMLTEFIKVVTYNGQVQFPPESWAIARQMATAKDETGIAFAALNDMVKRFENIGLTLEKIAHGDFTVEVTSLGEQDLIGNSIIKVVKDLNRVLTDITSVTNEVKGGAEQISAISQTLAEGSTEQAASIEELSASIAEIASKTEQSATLARSAATLSGNVMASAEKGNEQMHQLTGAVEDINEASRNISKIIKVIDDIAFQTNILALNAAVEAARAGEAGKGFAVVADEVRNLASKSAAAAKETSALIENSMKKAELGSHMAEETAVSLSDMVAGITQSTKIITDIADDMEQENKALDQISAAVTQVSNVVQSNSSSAEEAAAASEELNSQSEILAENVRKFII